MSELPERFRLATTPNARPESIIQGEHYRITMLTERLVRLEYSPSGRFEDRPTQMVLNRDFETPEFTLTRDGDAIQVMTTGLQLNYDGGPMTAAALSIQSLSGGYHSVWRPGHEPGSDFDKLSDMRANLGGTVRTLDTVDGAIDLEPGILSSHGIASLADAGMALGADGWVEPRIEGNTDTYVFAYGRDFETALADFYRLTGPQPVLPRFALGNWWSRYHKYTADEYKSLIERFEAEDLPFSVAVVDMDWHLTEIDPKYGNGWTGYTWNKEYFPDHVEFMQWLHDHGLKISLNVHPADGIRGFEEAYPRMAEAMGIDPASDLPVNFDITDPKFLRNYLELVHHPMEADGVDFWWLDWQQGQFTSVEGLDPLWMLNHFHYIDNARTGKRPMTFSRYAGPGSHRYPVGFSGDTVITWESLDFQPYMTATASNIGYGWWSHDIGGHCFGYKDDELATRWVQFGVFSPINRLHSTANIFNGKEPWRYNAIAEDVMGRFLRFRHRMVPYLYTMNELGHRTLKPLMRPMYYTHPDWWEAFQVDNQYWFGTELVVNAITSPCNPELNRAAVKTWLPQGVFIDVFTGLVYQGGRNITMHRSIYEYPVLAKAGAILPLTGEDEFGVGNPETLEIRVFAGADGEFVLYEDDDAVDARAVRTTMTFDWTGGRFTIAPAEGELDVVPAQRKVRLVLVGAEKVGVQGRESSYDEATGMLEVELGSVDTASGVEVVFDGPLRLHDNQLATRIFDFLNQAEIEFSTKERVMDVITKAPNAGRRMAMLAEWDLDDELVSALREFITAQE